MGNEEGRQIEIDHGALLHGGCIVSLPTLR
jgi:hypothetical protein